MTSYQSYSQRYSRQKSGSKSRTVSPNKQIVNLNNCDNFLVSSNNNKNLKIQSQSHFPLDLQKNDYSQQQKYNPHTIGHVVSKLTDRVDSIDIKITSLTNVVRLIQKYTEAKDQQYEKQKQNLQFKLQFKNIQSHQQNKNNKSKNTFEMIDIDYSNRVKEFQLLIKKIKSQLASIQDIKSSLYKQSIQKNIQTNYKTTTINHVNNNKNTNKFPINSQQSQIVQKNIIQDIQQMIQNMQDSLRDQLNRKIQICTNTFKALSNHQNKQNNQSSGINRVMLEEQIHTLTLNFNKMENQQHKNVSFILKKIEQIAKQVNKINLNKVNTNNSKEKYNQRDYQQLLMDKKQSKRKITNTNKKENQNLTPKSNRSQRSLSKGKNKKKNKNQQSSYNLSSFYNIGQKSKIKQQQLKEAIRKKRQAKQKLKVK